LGHGKDYAHPKYREKLGGMGGEMLFSCFSIFVTEKPMVADDSL
jgi:hypothetical protein